MNAAADRPEEFMKRSASLQLPLAIVASSAGSAGNKVYNRGSMRDRLARGGRDDLQTAGSRTKKRVGEMTRRRPTLNQYGGENSVVVMGTPGPSSWE